MGKRKERKQAEKRIPIKRYKEMEEEKGQRVSESKVERKRALSSPFANTMKEFALNIVIG